MKDEHVKDEHVKDTAQVVAEDVTQGVAEGVLGAATKNKGQRPSISPCTLFSIADSRDTIEIIDTRGTIDVFHTAPWVISP